MVDTQKFPTLEPENTTQVKRPFKQDAADGYPDKKKTFVLMTATFMALGVGSLYLSGVGQGLSKPAPIVSLEATLIPGVDDQVEASVVGDLSVPTADYSNLDPSLIEDQWLRDKMISEAGKEEQSGMDWSVAGLDPRLIDETSEPKITSETLGGNNNAPNQNKVSSETKVETPVVSSASSLEMNAKIEALIAMTSELQAEVKALRGQVGNVSSAIRSNRNAAASGAQSSPMVALSILDVTAQAVVVSDGKARQTVRVGERLPGGAVFMGYDAETKQMRTDRGVIQIPG